jgi:catechol 2,3-dioxygenase-like lactoylglutathione lyase family enzyme
LQEIIMNPKPAVVSLWTEDVEATAHFYRDVIGLKLLMHDQHRPHFDVVGEVAQQAGAEMVASWCDNPRPIGALYRSL